MKKLFVLTMASSLLVGQMYAMSLSPKEKSYNNQEEKITYWWYRDDIKLYADCIHIKPGQNYITLVRNPNIAISTEIMQKCLYGLSHYNMEFCVDASKLIAVLNKQPKPSFIQLIDGKYYALNIIIAKYMHSTLDSFEIGRLKYALRPIVKQVARDASFKAHGYEYLEEDNEYHTSLPESPRK